MELPRPQRRGEEEEEKEKLVEIGNYTRNNFFFILCVDCGIAVLLLVLLFSGLYGIIPVINVFVCFKKHEDCQKIRYSSEPLILTGLVH